MDSGSCPLFTRHILFLSAWAEYLLPRGLPDCLAERGVGEYHPRQVLQGQSVHDCCGELADHVRSPGAHHLSAQDAVGVGRGHDLDESPLLAGEDGFAVCAHHVLTGNDFQTRGLGFVRRDARAADFGVCVHAAGDHG